MYVVVPGFSGPIAVLQALRGGIVSLLTKWIGMMGPWLSGSG